MEVESGKVTKERDKLHEDMRKTKRIKQFYSTHTQTKGDEIAIVFTQSSAKRGGETSEKGTWVVLLFFLFGKDIWLCSTYVS